MTFTLAKGVDFRGLQVTVLSVLEKEENTKQNQKARGKVKKGKFEKVKINFVSENRTPNLK